MRIGDLARRSGVTAKTIRYYDDIGVVEPPARTPSGYCDYEPAALDRLAFIRAAQAIGLTLGEIRSILDDRFGIHAQVTPAAGTASTYLVG